MDDAIDLEKLQQAFENARKALLDLPANLPIREDQLLIDQRMKLKAVVEAMKDLDAAQYSKTHLVDDSKTE